MRFSGIVNIFLHTLMHTQQEKKPNLFKDKFLSFPYSPPCPPTQKCDLPEGAHNAALAEKVHWELHSEPKIAWKEEMGGGEVLSSAHKGLHQPI